MTAASVQPRAGSVGASEDAAAAPIATTRASAAIMKSLRPRFWSEAGLASLTSVLLLLTLVWRDWFEAVFKIDPDQHSGSLEWGIVLALLGATALAAGAAYADWRRAPAASPT